MKKNKHLHNPAEYQIKVKGNLGNDWSDWFDNMIVKSGGAVTTITGRALDQPALHGLLSRIRDLGLPLISVKLIKSNINSRTQPKGGLK
jgi:hypothetical protein